MDLTAEIRRFAKQALASGEKILRMTQFESVAMAQVEPPNAELTRAAMRVMLGNSAAVTGIAPVQALATTAAQHVLFNKAGSGVTYYVEEIGVIVTSGTPGVGGILFGCLLEDPDQTGGSIAGASVQECGTTRVDSNLILKSSVTITTPAAPVWFPLASNPSANVAAFPGSGTIERRDLGGAIAIQPGMGLGLYVLAPAGTAPLYTPFGRFARLASDMD